MKVELICHESNFGIPPDGKHRPQDCVMLYSPLHPIKGKDAATSSFDSMLRLELHPPYGGAKAFTKGKHYLAEINEVEGTKYKVIKSDEGHHHTTIAEALPLELHPLTSVMLELNTAVLHLPKGESFEVGSELTLSIKPI